MRRLVLALIPALGLTLAGVSARAQTIAPSEALPHAGQTVTVEGAVGNVHRLASGLTFIDIGGRYPGNPFTAVILAADNAKFPNVNAFAGRTVDITGKVQIYKGKPEIVLTDAAQIKAK